MLSQPSRSDPKAIFPLSGDQTGKDKTYDKGAFSTSYWGPIDNVIIADTEADILGVEPGDKLPTTWGRLKAIR